MKLFALDLEGDELYPFVSTIWVLVIRAVHSGNKLVLHPYKDMNAACNLLKFIEEECDGDVPMFAFHNGLGYDMWAIWKILKIPFRVGPDEFNEKPCIFLDTLFASQFELPDRKMGHSLGAWGDEFGFPKIDWRAQAIELGLIEPNAPPGAEFKQYHPDMDLYCEQDVLIQEKIALYFLDRIDYLGKPYKRGQKSFWLMQAQAHKGWKFDIEQAHNLVPQIEKMIEDLRAEVEPQLPPRKLKKTEEKDYKFPAKPFKKNGEFSSHMMKFIDKHQATVVNMGVVQVYGNEVKVVGDAILEVKIPMTMDDGDAIKDWFLALGWEPEFWNFKKGPDGKPLRDNNGQPIKTSPKIQENKKICPNLEAMDIPIVKQVVKFLSLRNRLGVLKGWIEDPRLAWDGRLSTASTGIAVTHRQKHAGVVNVPKAADDVLLGKEFRSLFIAEDGYEIAAADASGLENKITAHYTYKHDNGDYARLIEGDNHSYNAKIWYSEELSSFDITCPNFNKDDPLFKPYRNRAKNGLYALNRCIKNCVNSGNTPCGQS